MSTVTSYQTFCIQAQNSEKRKQGAESYRIQLYIGMSVAVDVSLLAFTGCRRNGWMLWAAAMRESEGKTRVLRRRNGIAQHTSSTTLPYRWGWCTRVSHSCLPLEEALVTTTLHTLQLVWGIWTIVVRNLYRAFRECRCASFWIRRCWKASYRGAWQIWGHIFSLYTFLSVLIETSIVFYCLKKCPDGDAFILSFSFLLKCNMGGKIKWKM